MLNGEFELETALYSILLSFVSRLIAWGTYAFDLNIYFFLCAFYQMSNGIPEISKFCARLADLHQRAYLYHRRKEILAFTLPRIRESCLKTTAGAIPGKNSLFKV
jgi:hypothetical protein